MLTARATCRRCGESFAVDLIPTGERFDARILTVAVHTNDVEYATHECEGL